MDLRGGLQKIRKSTFEKQASLESVSEIDVQGDFGCYKACDSDQCAVCLEKKCNTMLLPCTHQFHADCIIQWTERQFSCPLCRSEVSHFVPLRNLHPGRHAEFEKLWERHYYFPEKKEASPELKPKSAPKVSFQSTLKRTQSLAQLASLSPPPATHECRKCKGDLNDGFVYFAFDFRFCSTQCRLSYARENKRGSSSCDDGTTSLYVDHSQIAHYYETENQV